MTSAKTTHASNMMPDLVKPTHIVTKKVSESRCFIVPLLYWKKIEPHLKT